jgi:hypothetical protein
MVAYALSNSQARHSVMSGYLLISLLCASAAAWLTYLWSNAGRREKLRWGRFGEGPRLSAYSFAVWLFTLLGSALVSLLYHLDEPLDIRILRAFFVGTFSAVGIGCLFDNVRKSPP